MCEIYHLRISRTRPPLIAELGSPPGHVLLELLPDRIVERRLLVFLERLAPDLGCARGGVAPAVPLPALEVLGGREEWPVEAVAEALKRVRGAEEMTSRS